GCARGELPGAGGFAQFHFFEVPVAQVAVESIGTLQITKIDVLPAISVHVSDGHTRAIVRHSVGRSHITFQRIREPYPGGGGIHEREAWFGTGARMHLEAPKSCAIGPR